MKNLIGCFFSLILLSVTQIPLANAQNLVKSRQSSYYTLIYKISDDLARDTHDDIYSLKDSDLTNLYDTYHSDSTYQKDLPAGHYVFVNSKRGSLHAELHSVNNLTMEVLNNYRDLIVILYDSAGREVENAQVHVKKKTIPFDQTTRTYRLRKSNKQGILSVKYHGHTSYFSLNKKNNSHIIVRTGKAIVRSFPVRTIISPVVYLSSTAKNLVNGHSIHPPGIYYTLKRPFVRKNYTGYLAINKPKFKPLDSVMLKAFIMNTKGKPLNRSVTVKLFQHYTEYINVTLGKISPIRKGAYTFEFRLTDSLKLKLDRSCTIQLTDENGYSYVSNNFQYEDYDLKTNTYAVRSENNHGAEPATLYLKGTDSNDMPLYDVRVEVLVKPTFINDYFDDQVFVKDTLWFHKTNLETLGETKVLIPDSVMPNVNMSYQAIISFINSDNERTTKTQNLQYSKDELPISITFKDDSLILKAKSAEAKLNNVILSTQFKNKTIAEAISLPHTEKINPFVISYSAQQGTRAKTKTLESEADQLDFSALRTVDSLLISTINPRSIPFRYFLFRNKNLIESGATKALTIKIRSNLNDEYSLSVQYFWAGNSKTRDYQIHFNKKELSIDIAHAPIVYPGENTEFNISVKDAYGDPVADVDLTAFAITKKFGPQGIPGIPDFDKTKDRRKILNEFHLKNKTSRLTKRLDFAFWKKTLNLDSIAFYKFLYPDSGYFEHRSPAETSQFAPFIVRDYASNGVGTAPIIYVDDQPVYYHAVGSMEPYSFAVAPGVHTIKLRVPGALYTIQQVRIEPNQKLIFSIDGCNLPSNVTKTKMKSNLSDEEISKLARHFIRFESSNRDAYVSQGNRYFLLSPNSHHYNRPIIGPLFTGRMTFTENGGFSTDVSYQSFSSYALDKNTVRLQPFDAKSVLKQSLYYADNENPSFSEYALTKDRIESYWKNSLRSVRRTGRFPSFNRLLPRTGTIMVKCPELENKPSAVVATLIINLNNPDDYFIVSNLPSDEPIGEGLYSVVAFLPDQKYIKADSIKVYPFGKNYINISYENIQTPDSLSKRITLLLDKWASSSSYVHRERLEELQSLREQYYQQNIDNSLFPFSVAGRVTDSNGDPIVGVNVIIKGTPSGTITDEKGVYFLKTPFSGQLVFSFIGYETIERTIDQTGVINVKMKEDIIALSEVVVTAYAVSRRTELTGSVLSGRVAGISIRNRRLHLPDSVSIRIRGMSSINDNRTPLVVLDGSIVSLAEVPNDLITASEFLSMEEGMQIYGSQAANGVILLSTKKGFTPMLLKKMAAESSQALALEEVAGNSLRKNFRDYAFWKPNLKTDKNGQAKFHATFPDDITAWNAYVLAIGTKKRTGRNSSTVRSYKPLIAQIAQPKFLIEGDTAIAIGKVTNYGSDSLVVVRQSKVNNAILQQGSVRLLNSHIDSIRLIADKSDSLEVEYTLQLNNYRDGELRKLPIFKKGTMEATGHFFAFPSDTTFSIHVGEAGDQVRIYAQADLIDVLIDELAYLKNYVYECNEQLSSRLKALLMEKHIAEYKQKDFTGKREVEKVIRKLISNQNDDGSWGWWKSSEGEIWISLHVAKALIAAEKAGFKSSFDKESFLDLLTQKVARLPIQSKLEALIFLADQKQILMVDDLLDSVRTSKKYSTHQKIQAEYLAQRLGKKVNWKWVNTSRNATIKGNYYWNDVDEWKLHNNDILSTLLVYEMALKDDITALIPRIENYLLEKRNRYWRNTYESSLILESLLPKILARASTVNKPVLELSGVINQKVDKFPFDSMVSPGILTIQKAGNAPVYFTAYTEKWNPSPERKEKDFIVTTYFTNKDTTLTAGKPATLTIEVEVLRDAEYVMIEVPIPAGCSYNSKPQPRREAEVHREYYEQKTNIYCKIMRKGRYTYTIDLLPRFSGSYSLNSAVAECMYFPTFYGREEMKTIKIH